MSTPNEGNSSVGDDERISDEEVGDNVDAAEADPTNSDPAEPGQST